MVNGDCKTCSISALCATISAEKVFPELRRCRGCDTLWHVSLRRQVSPACEKVVRAWMLTGETENLCPMCGEKFQALIRERAVPDVIAECRSVKGFELNEGVQTMPMLRAVPAAGDENIS